MTNKYESYKSTSFKYNYPYLWEKRNRHYLKKFEDRQTIREFIIPSVYRIRFYDINNQIISDNFYTYVINTVNFPIQDNIEGKEFIGWAFEYNNEIVYVTEDNYLILDTAVNEGYDDLKLIATYIDIEN